MITLPFKLVRAVLNLLFKLLRKSVRMAVVVALATGVLFILDAFLLDAEPDREE
jgi:hypothetical protein